MTPPPPPALACRPERRGESPGSRTAIPTITTSTTTGVVKTAGLIAARHTGSIAIPMIVAPASTPRSIPVRSR